VSQDDADAYAAGSPAVFAPAAAASRKPKNAVKTQHADDAETHRRYRVQVSIYSRSGMVSLPDTDTAMTAAGFTKGPERQLPYDRGTRHFGLAKDYYYLDYLD
jgi:hypothetical protein